MVFYFFTDFFKNLWPIKKIFKKNIFDNYYLSERGVKTGVSRAIAITKRADDDIVAV